MRPGIARHQLTSQQGEAGRHEDQNGNEAHFYDSIKASQDLIGVSDRCGVPCGQMARV